MKSRLKSIQGRAQDLQSGHAFWAEPALGAASFFTSDLETGLTEQEGKKRLAAYGRNVLKKEKGPGSAKIFLRQLKSPLIAILIIAGAVTLAVSHFRDAAFIFTAVIINSFLGFWQENKAERALSELKTYLKERSRVIREGKDREIDSEEIVPGDIIRLSQGDRVPADGRIIFANDLQIDESLLTGESLPSAKNAENAHADAAIADQTSMVFAGTLVTQGIATFLACRTGSSTELGKIASLIDRSNKESTPLQKAIARFSAYLSLALTGLTVLVFAAGTASGKPPLEMFITSVALAVSAIPEGLPVSMTVILAIGVERMAKRKGVVRKLVAAEALGSATLIITDKTGTLTEAKMAMSRIVPFAGNEDAILASAVTNAVVVVENPEDDSRLWRIDGRIMEAALVRAASARGMAFGAITDKSRVVQYVPFNPVNKFSVSLVRDGEKRFRALFFGAADILLSRSSLGEPEKKEALERINALAAAGERVLAVAEKEVREASRFSLADDSAFSGLSFLGLIAFSDPVRKGVKEAVSRVGKAGIRTVIMTGDHAGTAIAVAKKIGLRQTRRSTIEAAEMATLSDSDLKKRLSEVAVISRVTPADKLRVIRLFREMGESVAMTGDGVNDAPSIKEADIGIAMGSGTQVAKNVADLILLDDNFETIVAAIEEGRKILGNIRKVLVYLLSNVADGIILIGGSILAGIPLPLNALQILWVNFFSDSFPAIAFAFEKDHDGLASRSARAKMSLFTPLTRFLVLIIGIMTSLLLFAVYTALLALGHDPALVRTFIFAAFSTYTLLLALSIKSLEKSVFSYSPFSNPYLAGGIGIGFALTAAAIYVPVLGRLFGTVPLPLPWVIGVLAVGAFNILLIEAAKTFFKRHRRSPR